MNDPFQRYRLRHVINVSGTETSYGSAAVRQEVLDAVAQIAPHSVIMQELQRAASQTITDLIGGEAGCVTGCTAASIAIGVAATMTGCDLGKVEQLPDTSGLKSKVILQKGHECSYGQSVSQNIRLAGARPVEIGTATQTGLYQLNHALDETVAAGFFVVSHLTSEHGMIGLDDFISACHAVEVPVIVDAASASDPRPLVKSGADLVLWSAHKGFASFTAGIIAGRHDLVHACLFQEHGIGRPMKVGKEGILGAIVALEAWSKDNQAQKAATAARVARVSQRLGQLPGIAASGAAQQVKLVVDPRRAGVSAVAVAACLADEDPLVLVWNHRALAGELFVTLSKVSDETADYVCARIEEAVGGRAKRYEENWLGVADSFEALMAGWESSFKTSRE
jgi:L-seryl-tRNA(Ser) seleniumtransferase